MKFYKITNDNSFIGVVYSGQFVAQTTKKKKLLYANETSGQFVTYNNVLYRDYWMAPIADCIYPFVMANVIEITEEEYNTLLEAINNHEEVIIDDDDDDYVEPIPTPVDPIPDITTEYVREGKINEMSATCRKTIENGFDLEIRGETQHFSLTTQDQLNLMNLNLMAQTQELIPYHADGETCIFYTPEEINAIIAAATSFKNYQLAYYNALKAYINSLETIEDISAITYGTPIPEEYKSDVLMVLE